MHLAHYLELQHRAATKLADAYRQVADGHQDEADVTRLCRRLAIDCDEQAAALSPFVERYAEGAPQPPDRLHGDLFGGPRSGGLGLLRDLHDLYLMAAECDLAWTVITQAAFGARDEELLPVARSGQSQTTTHLRWLRSRIGQAAPQALVVAA
jgi:hypothetical protein